MAEKKGKAATSTKGIGRYQLFHGSYDHFNLDENEGFERQSLLKIDTVTGQVWEFQSFTQEGTLCAGWNSINDT
tara:strand:+ start:643 stop:864 length:222 start_codon:yes stop_codon:yes gene_type:complete